MWIYWSQLIILFRNWNASDPNLNAVNEQPSKALIRSSTFTIGHQLGFYPVFSKYFSLSFCDKGGICIIIRRMDQCESIVISKVGPNTRWNAKEKATISMCIIMRNYNNPCLIFWNWSFPKVQTIISHVFTRGFPPNIMKNIKHCYATHNRIALQYCSRYTRTKSFLSGRI